MGGAKAIVDLSPQQVHGVLEKGTVPKQTLSVVDMIALILGVVIGTGIFKPPSMIAANTGKTDVFFLAWLAGGIISLIGALCYAELATAYPHTGRQNSWKFNKRRQKWLTWT